MINTHSEVPKQKIGAVVPEIELPCITGGARTLSSFLEGKKGVVVVFWSETCSHCIRYDAYLNGFASRHPELGIFAVASRQGEDLDQIRSTAAKRNLVFPILYDSGGSEAAKWFTQQTPRVFLVDAARCLLYRGAIDNFKYPHDPEHQGSLENAIRNYLAGKPIERAETASFGCAIQTVYYDIPKPLV